MTHLLPVFASVPTQAFWTRDARSYRHFHA